MNKYDLEILKLAARCKVMERATALALAGLVASNHDPEKMLSSIEESLRNFVSDLPGHPLEAQEEAEQMVDRLMHVAFAVLRVR